jgi:signal transduction histidine kinase/ligand-binding sensor domain-containing protein
LTIARSIAIVCVLLAWSMQSFAAARELGQPYFETIAGTEDIANGVITVVSQDRRGLLWLGTTEGLYSFDGQRLRAYRNQDDDPGSIGDDYVRGLLASSDGRLWVATQGAGLSVYDPKSDRFENFQRRPDDPHTLPSIATLTLAESASGDIWIGFGDEGLGRWNRASGHFERYDEGAGNAGTPGRTVRALQFDRDGDLWLGTGNGLRRLRSGATRAEWVASDPGDADGFDRQYVYALFEASDGRLWIGTQSDGAAVYDRATGRLTRLRTGANATSHPWVSGFVEPTPGRIWIHTYGGGIDVVDASTDRIVQRIRSDLAIPGGLALDRLTAPYQDRSGLIWVGTWGAGLQRHNPHNASAFRTLRHSPLLGDGLGNASVLSTLPLAGNRVWIGTGGAGIDVLEVGSGIVERHAPHPTAPGALRDGTIRALAHGADGSIWIGTQQAGLQRYLPATGRFSEAVDHIPRRPIRQLLARRDGTLAIGMQAALMILDPATGGVRRMLLAAERPFTDAVWSLAEDDQRNLWIGTPNALLLWAADAEFPIEVESSDVVLRAITDLRIDRSGQLWLSGPRGIARLLGWPQGRPQFENYGSRLAPPPQGLGQQLVPDREGRLWNPRVVIDPRTDRVESIGIADGIDIGSVEIGSGSVGENGLIYYGGTRGLLVIHPERYAPWRYTPSLLLTAIEVDGQPKFPQDLSPALRMLPGQRRLTVEFAALDYSAPTALRYAYRLIGLEPDWISADSTQRMASYHNLWPRDYRLEVRAQARGGQWSETLALPVEVVPAWWQTPLAALLAALLLPALGVLGVRLRTAQIGRRALALETLVEHRTHELRQAKSGAEHALVELKGAQRQLVAAEKMASLGQLVAGVAHEINTPVGIAITAASHLQELAAEGNAKLADNRLTRADLARWKEEVEEASRLILGSLTRAGTLIASFKQVSVDQSSGQRRRFRLREFLGEVQTALQPTLRRTPHQLAIHCEDRIELDSYPGALFQILTNLINNTIMHAFADGQSGEMRIDATIADGVVELRFSDTGRGMDADVANRAFDPFFTTRRGSGGSGLGLHVVHNLVTQLLAGDIELKTAPGAGTTFVLRFPAVTPEAGRAGG